MSFTLQNPPWDRAGWALCLKPPPSLAPSLPYLPAPAHTSSVNHCTGISASGAISGGSPKAETFSNVVSSSGLGVHLIVCKFREAKSRGIRGSIGVYFEWLSRQSMLWMSGGARGWRRAEGQTSTHRIRRSRLAGPVGSEIKSKRMVRVIGHLFL